MIGRRKKLDVAPVPPPAAEPVTVSPAERAAQVEAELHEAQADLVAAEGELTAAQRQYDEAADRADVIGAVAAKNAVLAAEVALDITRRHVERVQTQLTECLAGAATAADLAERERLHEVAQAALATYQAEFLAMFPVITQISRDLLRLWAEAEVAREAAGAVGIVLPHADSFRDQEGTPRIEVGSRNLDLWLNPWGDQPYDDAKQSQVKTHSDGSGTLYLLNHTEILHKKRRYQEVQFYPLVPGRRALSLAEALAIPAMTADGVPGWARPDGSGAVSPRAVLRWLDQLAAPRPAPAEPHLRTERRPLEPAREVAVKREVPRIGLSRSM